MSTHKARRGFSLLELLFIMATLAVLAAISFPVFVRAQQPRDPNQVCMSNLKQVGLGILQYTQDYDEKYPVLEYRSPRTGQNVTWRANIQPYVKSTEIFRCPINPFNMYPASADEEYNRQHSRMSYALRPGVAPKWNDNGTLANAPEDYTQVLVPGLAISYAANPVVMQRYAPIVTAPGAPPVSNMAGMADIQSPAELIMVGESTSGDAALNMSAAVASFGRGEVLFAGHFARTAFLYADGHVKMSRPSQTTPFWFNTPPDSKSYDYLARRLEAAEQAWTLPVDDGETAETSETDAPVHETTTLADETAKSDDKKADSKTP